MPNIRAAKKWARASAKRAERNQSVRTSLKTLYRKAVAEATPDEAKAAASAFDKAAARGIIHPNKASRKKARLARALAKKR